MPTGRPRRSGRPKMTTKAPRGGKPGKGPKGSEKIGRAEGELIKVAKRRPGETISLSRSPVEEAQSPQETSTQKPPRWGPTRQPPQRQALSSKTPRQQAPERQMHKRQTLERQFGGGQGVLAPTSSIDVGSFALANIATFAEGGIAQGKGIWAFPK